MNLPINSSELLAKIESYVDEFFALEKGAIIKNPEESFEFHDARLTRRQIKHIVESRIKEGRAAPEIKDTLLRALETIKSPTLEFSNPSQDYPGSIVRAKLFIDINKSVIVVLDKKGGHTRDVITIFSKKSKEYRRLEKKRGR